MVARLTAAGRRSGSTRRFHGSCLYLVDADGTAIRVIPEAEHPDPVDLQDRYLALWALRGDDNAAGTASSEDLRRWDRAFEATAQRPVTFFAPMPTAIGRRPAYQHVRS